MINKIIDKISSFVLIGIITFTILPIILLLLLSFSAGWKWPEILPSNVSFRAWKYVLLSTSGSLKAIWTSLQIGFITTVINLVLSIPAGDALGRYKFRGKRIIEVILFMPIVVPPIVVMMGLHKTFIIFGLTESIMGVVLAHMIPTLPYMIRAVMISFDNLGFEWEEQGKMLGAGKINRFFHIILPFLLPGIIAGSSLTISISLSQYIITMLIGGGQIVTLPILMFPFINGGDQGIGAAYSILFTVIAVISLIVMDLFLKKYYEDRKV